MTWSGPGVNREIGSSVRGAVRGVRTLQALASADVRLTYSFRDCLHRIVTHPRALGQSGLRVPLGRRAKSRILCA
jgi:hypothetical protein